MSHDGEYRYSPDLAPGPCLEHPYCVIIACHRFLCRNLIHRTAGKRGQPRMFCSPACRIAEHRRLHR